MPSRFYEGPRVIDTQSGGHFYQAYAIQVAKFGDIVDARKNHYDFDAEMQVGVFERPDDNGEQDILGSPGGFTPRPIAANMVINNGWYNP